MVELRSRENPPVLAADGLNQALVGQYIASSGHMTSQYETGSTDIICNVILNYFVDTRDKLDKIILRYFCNPEYASWLKY